jgi:hypothetical protein
MTLRRAVPLATLLVPLAACSLLTSSEGHVAVRLDPAAVQVTRSGHEMSIQAPVEIVNISLRTVYIAPCSPSMPLFVLQKQVGETWESILFPTCPFVASGPIRLRAGQSLTTQAWFHTYVDPIGAGGLRPEDVPGTYRFIAWIRRSVRPPGTDEPDDELLPLEQRASPSFVITG